MSLQRFLEIQRAATPAQEAEKVAEAADFGAKLGPYRVGPDDVLEVNLIGADGNPLFPPVRVRVDRNGEVELPVVKTIKVADMELQDVEDTIRRAYTPGVYKEAVCHAALVTPGATNVLVVGAVSVPGLVPLRRTERNLLYAIVGAGGVSELASGQATLRRIRRPAEEVTLDLTDPFQLRAALALEPLDDGDIVEVHAAQPNRIFVGGLVNRAGPQDYPPGTKVTVLQALAAANGLRTDIFPKEGTLIRSMPDGADLHVKLSLGRLARGEDPNIALAPGDIVWVPETWETRAQDFFNRNVFMRAGISVNYNVTGVEFLNRRSLQSRRTGGGGTLADTYDPLGFLTPNTVLPTGTTP
jgi:protein involved in polysaccharide export with SLBB domain